MTKLAPLVLSLALAIAAGCTKPNPAVCCLDEADCNEVGISEVRNCSPGLACVEHQCEVPTCSMTGCEATMPVCNITTDVCEGCASNEDCARFTDIPVCDTGSGSCVECVDSSDCAAPTAICDLSQCRGCKDDGECDSGACGDDGVCVDEASALYLDPGGTDAGTCPRSSPCRTVLYAIGQATDSRRDLVFAAGTYVGNTNVTPQATVASALVFHGHNAALNGTSDGTTLALQVSATIRDLEINAQSGGEGLQLSAGNFLIERCTFHQGVSIHLYTSGTFHDIVIENASLAIHVSAGQLTLDRGIIRNGLRGILATGGTVDIRNLLMFGTSELAMDLLMSSSSTVAFSTIADVGVNVTSGPGAIRCGSTTSLITLRSTIVWAALADRPAFDACNTVNVIAGPVAIPGTMNGDPMFENALAHDYHLASGSPARDSVDGGPSTDFEGDARPRGPKFDIGADEAP